MVNWQKVTIDDLRKLEALKNSLNLIQEKRAALELQAGAVRSSMRSTEAVSGSGANKAEDKMVDNIIEKERLGDNYTATVRLIRRVEKGLELLSDTERKILDRFYIHRIPDHVDRLCEELGYEKTRVYEMKETALRKLTYAMYGVQDL